MLEKNSAIFSWIITLLTPLFLIGLALRILLTPLFYNIEYRMPYFPPDSYGFTTEDRLHWAPYAVNYLINDADVSYLGNLTFEDGSPLYNERELSHMRDVKVVVKKGLAIWNVCLLALVAFWVWSWREKRWQVFNQGLRRGAWLTIGLVITLGFFAAVAFWQFFTIFHSLFFEGDSWIFLYSDTLIRLLPIRFWQDAFIAAGLIVTGGALVLALKLKPVEE